MVSYGQKTSSPQSTLVRDFVTSLETCAHHLYSSTLSHSPEIVKNSVNHIEHLVTPYSDPLLTKLKERGEPLINVLDQTVASHILPRAKAVEQTVHSAVNKSEDVWKASKQLAFEKVNASKQLAYEKVTASKQLAVETVATTEATAVNTYHELLGFADRVVDRVLPEPAEDSSKSESDGSSTSSNPVKITRKVATRLLNKATEVYTYSAERAMKVVHVDFVGYAKAKTGFDDEKIAKAFDYVFSHLPNAETTQKLGSSFENHLPADLKPAARKATNFATPYVNATFGAVARFVLLVRSFVLPSDKPTNGVSASHADHESVPSAEPKATPSTSTTRTAPQNEAPHDDETSETPAVTHAETSSGSRNKKRKPVKDSVLA